MAKKNKPNLNYEVVDIFDDLDEDDNDDNEVIINGKKFNSTTKIEKIPKKKFLK